MKALFIFGKKVNLRYTVKPLNNTHLGVLKNVSVIERCPLLVGNLKRLSHWDLTFCPLFMACPPFGMSAIGRFHCTKIKKYKPCVKRIKSKPKTLKVKVTINIYIKNFTICPTQMFMHTLHLKFGPWPVLIYSLNLGNVVSGFYI